METSNHLYYLAPEIWAIIFDKLECTQNQRRDHSSSLSGNDLLNCSRVCTRFQTILNGTKCQWLFQEVLLLVIPFLEGQSLSSLRATCKSWKYAVDNFTEFYNHYVIMGPRRGRFIDKHLPLEPMWSGETYLSVQNSICSFYSNAQIYNFLKSVQRQNKNPFPGAALRLQYIHNHLEDDIEDNAEHFWNGSVIQLLCLFGEHVRVLDLRLQDRNQSDYTYLELRQKIDAILPHVPNLKTLRIQGHINEPITWYYGSENCLADRAEHSLPFLETIEFNAVPPHILALPCSLQLRISMPYFSQLKRLKLTIMDPFPRRKLPGESFGFSQALLPQLEELDLTLVSTVQFGIILNLASNSAKLRRIVVEFPSIKYHQPSCLLYCYEIGQLCGEKVLNLCDILRPLLKRPFTKSLDSLSVLVGEHRFWSARAEQSDLETLVNFSSLKYLRIERFRLMDLNVVRCLPKSLQYLAVLLADSGRGILRVSRDIPNVESIYESTLWTELPHLRWLALWPPRQTAYLTYRMENWEWLMKSKMKCK